jgi:hypothetical protein
MHVMLARGGAQLVHACGTRARVHACVTMHHLLRPHGARACAGSLQLRCMQEWVHEGFARGENMWLPVLGGVTQDEGVALGAVIPASGDSQCTSLNTSLHGFVLPDGALCMHAGASCALPLPGGALTSYPLFGEPAFCHCLVFASTARCIQSKHAFQASPARCNKTFSISVCAYMPHATHCRRASVCQVSHADNSRSATCACHESHLTHWCMCVPRRHDLECYVCMHAGSYAPAASDRTQAVLMWLQPCRPACRCTSSASSRTP